MASPYALDFNPLMHALESNQQADFTRNRLAMEQRRLGMAEESHGWERALQPLKLRSAELGVERDTKMLPLDLRARTAEATRGELGVDRERAMMPLDVAAKRAEISGLSYSNEAKRRELEKDLYGRAAAIGQLVENEPDLEKQKALLQRWYTTDPTIRQHLGTTLPKELLDDPVAVTRYLRAVAAGYQAPQVHNLGPDHTLVTTTRDPANPTAPPKMGVLYKSDGKKDIPAEYVSDPAKPGALKPRPGGPADKITAEQAARVALIMKGVEDMPKIREIYLGSKDGKSPPALGGPVDPGAYAMHYGGFGNVGEGQRLMASGMEGVLRALTGAAATKEEVAREVQKYLPLPSDSPDTRARKLDLFERNLRSIAEVTGHGVSGSDILARLKGGAASPGAAPDAPPRFGGPPALREGAAPAPVAPRAEAPAPTAPRLPPGTTPDMAIQQAREAIAAGKDRNAVIQRLRELGISPSGL